MAYDKQSKAKKEKSGDKKTRMQSNTPKKDKHVEFQNRYKDNLTPTNASAKKRQIQLLKNPVLRWLQLLDVQNRFAKVRSTTTFKSLGLQSQSECIHLTDSLRHLRDFLNRHNDNEIAAQIERGYVALNQTSLSLQKGDEKKIKTNKQDPELVQAISSDVCRLAFMKRQDNSPCIPYKVGYMAWQTAKWGILEAMRNVETTKQISVNENVIINPPEFQRLLDEKKRLMESKEIEICKLNRKHPGVLKFLHKEKQKKRKGKYSSILEHSLRFTKKFNYRAETPQIDYAKIQLFYATKFNELDTKVDRLLEEQQQKFELFSYEYMPTSPFFKNCLQEIILPHEHYMNTLRRILEKSTSFSNMEPTSGNSDGAMDSLKSFSIAALDVVFDAAAGW